MPLLSQIPVSAPEHWGESSPFPYPLPFLHPPVSRSLTSLLLLPFNSARESGGALQDPPARVRAEPSVFLVMDYYLVLVFILL